MSVMSRRARPEDLITILRTPDLVDPVLIVQLDGWIDAGNSAADAMRRIRDATEPTVLARFDTEWLIDHRARRPTMHISDGVNSGLDWPVVEMSHARDRRDRDILLLHGAEPDHNWRAFVQTVVAFAVDQGTHSSPALRRQVLVVSKSSLTLETSVCDLKRRDPRFIKRDRLGVDLSPRCGENPPTLPLMAQGTPVKRPSLRSTG